MVELDDELVHGLVLVTEPVLVENRTGAPAESKLQIFPQTLKWPFRILACVLNERGHEWEITESIRLRTIGKLGAYYLGVCARSGILGRQNVRSRLLPHQSRGKFKIVVAADVTWFISDWPAHPMVELTATDTHDRTLAQPNGKTFVRYRWSLPPFAILRPTSQALLGDEPVLVTDPDCLSQSTTVLYRNAGQCLFRTTGRRIFFTTSPKRFTHRPFLVQSPISKNWVNIYTGICC
jgi:hypothetical protein